MQLIFFNLYLFIREVLPVFSFPAERRANYRMLSVCAKHVLPFFFRGSFVLNVSPAVWSME